MKEEGIVSSENIEERHSTWSGGGEMDQGSFPL